MKTETNPPGILYVCSTSHLDWDWMVRFEDYYTNGITCADGPVPCCFGKHNPVRDSLDALFKVLDNHPEYQFNLAELAWLQRYLTDNPALLSKLAGYKGRLFFMGAGITSPDNQVCDGELFIRNFLVGYQWLQANGLEQMLSPVLWVPDDFGQDPNLPVTVNALEFLGAGFWRVPGQKGTSPTNGTASISDQLSANGVSFLWRADDGSVIPATWLNGVKNGDTWGGGYGVIWNQNDTNGADSLNKFVTQANVKFPGRYFFAPCGGDFDTPSAELLNSVSTYNSKYGNNSNVKALLGTFEDYLRTITNDPATLGDPIRLNPSNYYTGYFASKPATKRNHKEAVNNLLAAETASTLLRALSDYPGSELDKLNASINQTWNTMAPISHHDFVTGTSPNQTPYNNEQLIIVNQALGDSGSNLQQAMTMLAGAIRAQPQSAEIPYVVFNPTGANRRVGNLVEMPLTTELMNIQSVRIGNEYFPVQPSSENTLLFMCPDVGSMAYKTVYLSTQKPPQPVSVKTCSNPYTGGNYFTMSNGIIQVTISPLLGWGLVSIKDVQNGCREMLANDSISNALNGYTEAGTGDPYKMGNELSTNGFYIGNNGNFSYEGEGSLIENGPLRWRFSGKVSGLGGAATGTMQYTLEKDEPMVRIRFTGSDARNSTSVVSSWSLSDSNGQLPDTFTYGTANHWHVKDTVPYWGGPTFQATHNFCLFSNRASGQDLGGIYHLGIPSWTLNNNIGMGILLRNPGPISCSGTLDSTDTDTHTQDYAYRLPGVGDPTSGQAIQESLAFQLRQQACPIPLNTNSPNPMPESGQFARCLQPDMLIRMARTQDLNLGDAAEPFSFVMRCYQPSNSTAGNYTLELPWLPPGASASMVSAIEEPSGGVAKAIVAKDTFIAVQLTPTLGTVKVETAR